MAWCFVFQLVKQIDNAPAEWGEFKKLVTKSYNDAPDKMRFLAETAKKCSTEFQVKQAQELERFSTHEAKVLLTTSKVDRGYDNSCLEMVILDGVPIDYNAIAKGQKLNPKNPNKESFLHRVGRVGRYGKRGVALIVSMNQDAKERWEATARDPNFNLRTVSRDDVLEEITATYKAAPDKAVWRQKVETNPAWGWTNARGSRESEREVACLTLKAEHIVDINAAASRDVFSEPLMYFLKREIRKEKISERLPNSTFHWDHMSKLPKGHPTWYVSLRQWLQLFVCAEC